MTEVGGGRLGAWLAGLTDDELDLVVTTAVTPGFLRAGKAVMRQLRLPLEWASRLNQLADQGWTETLFMEAALAVRQARRQLTRAAPMIVSTQPGVAEPGFTDTPVVLRRLFDQAEREVLLAGFRVTDRDVLAHLERPSWRTLDVRLFVDLHPELDGRSKPCKTRPAETHPSLWWTEFLADIWPSAVPRPRAWYAPSTLQRNEDGWLSMHIKCVVVDRRRLLLTSANFTARGLFRNFELGVVLDDPGAAEAVIRHFEAQAGRHVFVAFEVPVPGGKSRPT